QAAALDQRLAAGAGPVEAVALPGGCTTSRQPGVFNAGRAGQEPVRLPLRPGPRSPGRLAAAATLGSQVKKPEATHARTDPAAPRPRRAPRRGAGRPRPPALAGGPGRGRRRRALAGRAGARPRLRAAFAGAAHARDA